MANRGSEAETSSWQVDLERKEFKPSDYMEAIKSTRMYYESYVNGYVNFYENWLKKEGLLRICNIKEVTTLLRIFWLKP